MKIRRKLLKSIAIAAPITWSKPVIDSVLLPAHGMTSCGCEEFDGDAYLYVPDTATSGVLNRYFAATDCTDNPDSPDESMDVVVAEDSDQAATRWNAAFSDDCSAGDMSNLETYSCVNLWICGDPPDM